LGFWIDSVLSPRRNKSGGLYHLWNYWSGRIGYFARSWAEVSRENYGSEETATFHLFGRRGAGSGHWGQAFREMARSGYIL